MFWFRDRGGRDEPNDRNVRPDDTVAGVRKSAWDRFEADGPTSGAAQPNVVLRAAASLRPVFLSAVAFVIVAVAVRVLPHGPPLGFFDRYTLEVAVLVSVGLGALASVWAMYRGWLWDADLWPTVYGGIAAFTLLMALHGTPFAPNGLQGDQVFRTEAITRFADTWTSADFTYRGLPAFYPSGYLWILGRIADVAGIDPWRMTKDGTIAATMLAPLVCYLLWRRLVPRRVAALIAVVPLVVVNYYEPYSWLVLVTIVPWWLETVHGITRADVRPLHPILLGSVGLVMFLTYYYFFFVAAIALVIHLVAQSVTRALDWAQLRRTALAFAVIGAGSGVFWLPLVLSILGAHHPMSEANRWFSSSGGIPNLPFTDPSPVGALTLVGLCFLVLTARTEALSRGLLVFLAAAYAWYLLGWPAAALDAPLLTLRAAPLISVILVTAGVLALVRIAPHAGTWLLNTTQPFAFRFRPVQLRTVGAVLLLVVLLGTIRSFMTTAYDDPSMEVAQAERRPNGSSPASGRTHGEGPFVSVDALSQAINARYSGPGHPVVLSTRSDLLALTPYYGFVQWQVYYSHPAGQFEERISFLRQLAASRNPQEFAERTMDNPYDRIDAFVLRENGDDLVFEFRDDNFPQGAKPGSVTFPRSLFGSAEFDLVDLGEYVVATLR